MRGIDIRLRVIQIGDNLPVLALIQRVTVAPLAIRVGLTRLVDEAGHSAHRVACTRGYATLYSDRAQHTHPDFVLGKDTRPVTRESH